MEWQEIQAKKGWEGGRRRTIFSCRCCGEAEAELKRKEYERAMEDLQVELVKLQAWVRHVGARIIVVFEGRDAAGKGGVIKRITERVSPRVFRVIALPAPNDREKSQLYVQRYIAHLPAAGEIALFDRSWYNRAGVEKVLGFCTMHQHESFLRNCDRFEQALIDDGIILLKYWLSVSQDEQERRFRAGSKIHSGSGSSVPPIWNRYGGGTSIRLLAMPCSWRPIPNSHRGTSSARMINGGRV